MIYFLSWFRSPSMVYCGNCAENISRPDYVDGKMWELCSFFYTIILSFILFYICCSLVIRCFIWLYMFHSMIFLFRYIIDVVPYVEEFLMKIIFHVSPRLLRMLPDWLVLYFIFFFMHIRLLYLRQFCFSSNSILSSLNGFIPRLVWTVCLIWLCAIFITLCQKEFLRCTARSG